MRQTVPLVVVAVAALAVLAVPAMGVASTADGPTQAENNATAPGEKLSGAINVQGAELDGEVDQRAFGIRFGQAPDNSSKAAVLADRLQTVDERLTELEERKADLKARHDAGEITDGKFRAEMAKIATPIRLLSQATNQTQQAATAVPRAALEERGVNATAIQTLRDRASELSGPEVAAIARDIAGPNAGEIPGRGNGPPRNETGAPDANNSRGGGPPDNRGGPDGTSPNDQADDDQPPGDDSRENTTRGPDDEAESGDSDDQTRADARDNSPANNSTDEDSQQPTPDGKDDEDDEEDEDGDDGDSDDEDSDDEATERDGQKTQP